MKTMKCYLKKSKRIQVGNRELEHFLLSPRDAAINIMSFAETACGEGGRKKFAVLKTK